MQEIKIAKVWNTIDLQSHKEKTNSNIYLYANSFGLILIVEINLHQLFGHYKVVKNNTFEQSPHFEQVKTFKSLCSCSEIKLVLSIIYFGAPERLFILV